VKASVAVPAPFSKDASRLEGAELPLLPQRFSTRTVRVSQVWFSGGPRSYAQTVIVFSPARHGEAQCRS
jgi:hypothetical protein